MQQEPEEASPLRSELLERLRAMEGPQSRESLSELAYRRAREALERALEEARTIRLQAIEDARATREHELASLVEQLQALRQNAEAQIESLLREAEIEAGRLRDQAHGEAASIIERATSETAQIRAEAAALRASAEDRLREIERLETELNRVLDDIAERLGMKEKPPEGWWKRLTGGGK